MHSVDTKCRVQCPSVVQMDCSVLDMEDKPYSVDSSDDINIEEEEEEHIEENHSEYILMVLNVPN